MSDKKAVLIGAGQFGRGVIAMLLSQSGYDVLLADINGAVIEDINKRHEYCIRRLFDNSSEVKVENISAIDSRDPALIDACADCDIICTCVGLTAIPVIAESVAKSISKRYAQGKDDCINIMACENALGGSTILKKYVTKYLNDTEIEYLDGHIGFPDCAIDGIIPPDNSNQPADVTAEEYYEWDSIKSGFRGEFPAIKGLNIVDDLSRYLERKLFTLNGPNAVTGSMGFYKGYRTVQESLADKEIYDEVWEMMTEAGKMLSARHGFTDEEMKQYREFIMKRFLNPNIIDSCERVTREPIRKLGPSDRIVAPMNMAHEYGIETPAYYKGIAYMLKYSNANDSQSMEIQRMLNKIGFDGTLEKITGINPESETAKLIKDQYGMII